MGKNSEFDQVATKLSIKDKNILKSYEAIVNSISTFLGNNCEVVLQSLEDPKHAVIKIVNGHHTKRSIGSPLSEHAIQIIQDFRKTGKQDLSCYTTSDASGSPMRSIFTVITNENKAVGLLGINFNMSISLLEFTSTFNLFNIQPEVKTSPEKEEIADSVENLIHKAVTDMVMDISTNIDIPNHEKNKYIVYGLSKKGIFDIKGSVVMVAKELMLSKYTIYSYIRELREKNK